MFVLDEAEATAEFQSNSREFRSQNTSEKAKKETKKNNEEIKTRSQRYTRGKQNTLG